MKIAISQAGKHISVLEEKSYQGLSTLLLYTSHPSSLSLSLLLLILNSSCLNYSNNIPNGYFVSILLLCNLISTLISEYSFKKTNLSVYFPCFKSNNNSHHLQLLLQTWWLSHRKPYIKYHLPIFPFTLHTSLPPITLVFLQCRSV